MAHCLLLNTRPRVGDNIPAQIGDPVRFRAGNVFVWPREGPLSAVPADAEMEGKVVGFSDSGSEPRVFAVVEVLTKHTVIVPVTGLEVIEKHERG